MMIETSDGTRVELLANPIGGGIGLFDSRDGKVSGTFSYCSAHVDIGQPLRYVSSGQTLTLPYGHVVNTLGWLPLPQQWTPAEWAA